MYGFQKLEIYTLAKSLAINIYATTSEFPYMEKYALCQQLRRAAVSIPSNIAEGSSRAGIKDKQRFINIAYGSLMEVICQMEIAKDLNYIKEERYNEFLKSSEKLSIKLSNYSKSMKLQMLQSNSKQ